MKKKLSPYPYGKNRRYLQQYQGNYIKRMI